MTIKSVQFIRYSCNFDFLIIIKPIFAALYYNRKVRIFVGQTVESTKKIHLILLNKNKIYTRKILLINYNSNE